MFQNYSVVVVGSGFFGATIAERVANDLGRSVLVIDRRSHIGGNSWSEVERSSGIEHHVYGSHLFHTNSEEVWSYVNRFDAFTDYRHRVMTVHGGRIYSMPINLGTVCSFFGAHMSPDEARSLIASQTAGLSPSFAKSLEEKAISLIGQPLYEAFIKGYTAKQWQIDPKQLPASIITRLPVRYNFNDRYFSDRFEGLPTRGYGALFEKILSNPRIELKLQTDYFDVKDQIADDALVVYTGPIDRFFEYRAGRLSWRTLDFQREVVATEDFQGTSVVNYADEETPFTRIHEFKHLHPEREHAPDKTYIAREFSRFAGRDDEPFYPVATDSDLKAYQDYKKMAQATKGVIFGGRLGTYRYIDMHQAIGSALNIYAAKIKPELTGASTRELGPR